MPISTYQEFQELSTSEKITMSIIEPGIRLMGWVLDFGSIYKIDVTYTEAITSIHDYGVIYTAVGSIGAIVPGSYYFDRSADTLYVRASDSSNPNGRFLVMLFKVFFSNIPTSAPHDLSSGYEVEWLPYIKQTSKFGVEIDNKNQLGFAIEGTGSIDLINDKTFWSSIFDKWTWENKSVEIYSWYRGIPITESKLIYRGFINKKSWKAKTVSFSLKDIINELKNIINLKNIQDYPGAIVTNNLLLAKQRRVYGYLYGHIPTPIDQIVGGYTGSGTINVTFGLDSVLGIGTSFLLDLSPGDQLTILDLEYTIQAIASNTSMTLTEPFEGPTRFGESYTIKPKRATYHKNRSFLVAGHATKEPATTVVDAVSFNYIQVADDTDFLPNDKIKIGSEYVHIKRVSSGFIKLKTNLVALPSPGDVVTRPSVGECYIDNKKLLDTDYAYDADIGILDLTDYAEVNIAPTFVLIGVSVSFSSGLRTVSGVGTKFTTQLKPGDRIRAKGQAEYFEVLSVTDDTNLELRTPATYTFSDVGVFKTPSYYLDGSSVLSVDVIGRTFDNTKTGDFIKTGPDIIKDILIEAGLGPHLDMASFDAASETSPSFVGLAIPVKMSEKKTKTIRAVIGDISSFVFGSLIQTNDFLLAYNILAPTRSESNIRFNESDILSFSIDSDSSKLIRTALVNYLFKEYDWQAGSESNYRVFYTPDINLYLTGSVIDSEFISGLVVKSDADIFAQRMSFLLQLSRATVSVDTKLRGMRLSVNDRVWLKHEKLYERIGTVLSEKVCAIDSVKKSGLDVEMDLEDLSGAFSRCSTVTENSALDYFTASTDDLIINGFITDEYGIVNGGDTFGVNLIW